MTYSVGVSLRTPGWAPWGLVLSTPFIHFAWVSRILLSAWFEWYLVRINSAGELAGESMLCMSGYARHVPEASVHPAVCHSQPVFSRDHQTRTIRRK